MSSLHCPQYCGGRSRDCEPVRTMLSDPHECAMVSHAHRLARPPARCRGAGSRPGVARTLVWDRYPSSPVVVRRTPMSGRPMSGRRKSGTPRGTHSSVAGYVFPLQEITDRGLDHNWPAVQAILSEHNDYRTNRPTSLAEVQQVCASLRDAARQETALGVERKGRRSHDRRRWAHRH